MTDQEHAAAITEAARALNVALRAAREANLLVYAFVHDESFPPVKDQTPTRFFAPTIVFTISRDLAFIGEQLPSFTPEKTR